VAVGSRGKKTPQVVWQVSVVRKVIGFCLHVGDVFQCRWRTTIRLWLKKEKKMQQTMCVSDERVSVFFFRCPDSSLGFRCWPLQARVSSWLPGVPVLSSTSLCLGFAGVGQFLSEVEWFEAVVHTLRAFRESRWAIGGEGGAASVCVVQKAGFWALTRFLVFKLSRSFYG